MKIRLEPVIRYTASGEQGKFFIQLMNNVGDIYAPHDLYLSKAELLNLKQAIEEVLETDSIVYNQL